jgi:hypothetical protein
MLLLASGLATNYLFERHNVFKVWENSTYAVSWADLVYPPVCFFLSITGVALTIGWLIRHADDRKVRRYVVAISISFTLIYALFVFCMQFIATGADRLGECPGLTQAAASSKVIPDSRLIPGRAAVGCAVERRGMFLSYYNDLWVYGVTDSQAQKRVVDKITEYSSRARTHPVQVMFYEHEAWSVLQGNKGALVGSRGPTKLIRVVNIG